ncbi:hypothetical protein FMN63_16015 [Stappia sp. BW2]|uniref:hypothetical protein n=1 Tax=Stappia sp. BW2 TaxID=2592622 RepID=UPI0011DEE130|nr:hypothetical protein [Stappia sp. BW2]TYC67567.1 hypothetical protein FMN63_16015 [Stappia sp. BW2]
MIVRFFSAAFLISILALGGCQSSNQSGDGLEDGSSAPPIGDLTSVDQGPDGDPDACSGAMSEGTSMTPGC